MYIIAFSMVLYILRTYSLRMFVARWKFVLLIQGAKPLSNPHSELAVPLMTLPPQVQELLFGRPG